MARRLCAGDLRHRVTIQAEQRSDDGYGGSSLPTWSTVATVWAEVKPLKGREQLHGQQLEGRVTHRIIMRYRAGVTAANRLLFGTRAFNIRSVVNVDERGRWLEIMAEEGVAT